MKKLVLLILGFSALASAQSTIITATVTDSDGTLWTNGTAQITFVPNPSQPNLALYRFSGAPLSTTVTNQGPVSLGNPGTLSFTIYDNSLVTPIGSTWKLQVCPQASSSPCGSITFAAVGSGTNVSSQLTAAIQAPRFLGVAGAYGYADVEAIVQTVPGSTYYNTNAGCQKYYNTLTAVWSCFASGGTFLPLSGGTLTGSLTGTSGLFSNIVTAGTASLASGQGINILSKGAVAGRCIQDAVFNGTTTLTSATANFTSADTGSFVSGGGNYSTSTAYLPALITTITYVSSTQVTLSHSALGSASGQYLCFGPDSTPAINTATATGQPIIIPQGDFIVGSSTITVGNNPQAYIVNGTGIYGRGSLSALHLMNGANVNLITIPPFVTGINGNTIRLTFNDFSLYLNWLNQSSVSSGINQGVLGTLNLFHNLNIFQPYTAGLNLGGSGSLPASASTIDFVDIENVGSSGIAGINIQQGDGIHMHNITSEGNSGSVPGVYIAAGWNNTIDNSWFEAEDAIFVDVNATGTIIDNNTIAGVGGSSWPDYGIKNAGIGTGIHGNTFLPYIVPSNVYLFTVGNSLTDIGNNLIFDLGNNTKFVPIPGTHYSTTNLNCNTIFEGYQGPITCNANATQPVTFNAGITSIAQPNSYGVVVNQNDSLIANDTASGLFIHRTQTLNAFNSYGGVLQVADDSNSNGCLGTFDAPAGTSKACIDHNGNLTLSGSYKGIPAIAGLATLVAGVSGTISTTSACTPNSTTCIYKLTNVFINASTALGCYGITNVVVGVSFKITSFTCGAVTTQTGDVSSINWQLN